MFSKISARILLKVLNAPTISHHINSKTVRLMSWKSSNNIDYQLMSNVERLQPTQRKRPSTVFNSVEATQLNIPTERKEFMALFPVVLQDTTELVEKLYNDKDFVDRIIRAVEYNVPKGKHIYAMSLIVTYKHLLDPVQLTSVSLKMIRLLGWIFEMMVGAALVVDDIIDGGKIRRNQQCWHLLEDVQLTSINDVLMMENLAYYLLKKYFSHLSCYPKLFEEFHKLSLTTSTGQLVDMLFTRKGVNYFTMDNFRKLSYLKTSYGACCAQFALVTKLIGIDNPELYHQVNPILNEIGLYKQIQNDFYGCFGDSGVLGTPASDTEIGQCNWLAVKCMEIATPAQRKIMIECFGKQDSEKAKLVKQLYEELNIPDLYYQLEDDTYNKLAASIKDLSCGIQNDAILNILNMNFNQV